MTREELLKEMSKALNSLTDEQLLKLARLMARPLVGPVKAFYREVK